MNKLLKTCFITLVALSTIGLAPASFGQYYDAEEQATINVYAKINPTIVSIDAQLKDGISSGTGCIIRGNGIILTSSHVIEDSTDIDITISTGQVYKAKILSILGDNNDLALLKINTNKPLKVVGSFISNRISFVIGSTNICCIKSISRTYLVPSLLDSNKLTYTPRLSKLCKLRI